MASAAQGTRVTRLEDKAYVSGGSTSIQTAGMIPPGRRILAVLFRLDTDLTQPGAAAAAQLGSVLHQLISLVKIGRRVAITGLGLRMLNWLMYGREHNFPAGFPATLNGVFSRGINWALSYIDPSAESNDDGAVPSELWTDPIEISFGTASNIFAATVPTVTGTLRTYVVHDADPGLAIGRRDIPVSLNIQSEGPFNSLPVVILKPGKWVYAVAYREVANDSGAITSANVSAFTSNIDGEPVVNNARAQDYASIFNLLRAEGNNIETESQTDPRGGEAIDDLPGVAAAAGQGTAQDYQPLLFPPFLYRASQIPTAESSARFDVTGTLANFRVAYRIIEPRPDSSVVAAAARLGFSPGSPFEPKTGSGKTLDVPGLASFLPVRVRRATTPAPARK